MATVAEPETRESTSTRRVDNMPERDQVVVLRNVGWKGYMKMLRIRGDRGRPRMLYLDGEVHLMAPGYSHERDKERFGMFVVEMAVGLNIPFIMAGSTTYRRRKEDAAVEPDQSYYLANVDRVRNKKDIKLTIDPPPDLSIEVVYSNSAEPAIEVSRRLGVPEVWVCDEEGLTFLVLGTDREYAPSPTSPAFPFLSAAEIVEWVRKPDAEGGSDTDWIRSLRQWVQQTIIPRAPRRAD